MKKTILAICGALCILAARAAEDNAVPYPQGYRTWRHIKSMVIEEGHPLFKSFGGIHHLYANAKAVEGYRSGHFPDGAVIAFDLLEANHADHAISAGERKVLGVMHRDRKKYATTGGWGFEGFVGDSKTQRAVGDRAVQACFGCHQAQKDREFVFSEM